jgi:hypothetical protein
MNLLITIHSHNRWLIVLVAAAAILKFAWGWLKGGSFKKIDRILASAFSGLMDLQALLGLIYFFLVGFSVIRIEHATTMFIAAVVAHLPARWKKSGGATRFRNTLFAILFSLLLVYVGVMRLPGGWNR